ncbi:hypothetical protein CesoFtcFv8_003320 [Champsocephalus esox]|uniref:Uncharacterized protein n=1 Tax=Champsocephalus esox TaxID=159716 RepID=A0AAN8CSD1_9TELE|nr:hypothetical protein CesoFtcFv8_003320 [Champsocephalus esox]
MRASSSVGKHRENIVMLNDASHREKRQRPCGRLCLFGPASAAAEGCKQLFRSAVPPSGPGQIKDGLDTTRRNSRGREDGDRQA